MSRLDRCLNIYDLRDAARRRMPRGLFEFIDRGSEDDIAGANNRAAFERIKLRHRALTDVSRRTTATSLFGKPASMPMAIGPTGIAGLCWHEGEVALAKAAAQAKIPFTLATGSLTSLERVAEQAGGTLWFQLYNWNPLELSFELTDRAQRAGYETLVVTVDTVVVGNREFNTHNGFAPPFNPTWRFKLDMLRHPGWCMDVLAKYLTTTGIPRNENYPADYDRMKKTDPAAAAAMTRHDAFTWDDLKRLRDRWPGPFVIKGLNRADDAVKALQSGVDGIVVSNHGGRNMDSAVAPIDVLPEIVDAVGGRMTVLLDSGVRRGSDIAKALALGADGVLSGRATLYGVTVGGQAGAFKAINLLRGELDKTMALTGCSTVGGITRDILFEDRPARGLPAMVMQQA